MSAPLVLRTLLGQYTNPIFTAGRRSGEASEKFRWPWQSNEREIEEIRLAWAAHDAAFDRLYEYVKDEVDAAYQQGRIERGRHE